MIEHLAFATRANFADAASSLTRQWYLDVNIQDQCSNPLQDANITVEDVVGMYTSFSVVLVLRSPHCISCCSKRNCPDAWIEYFVKFVRIANRPHS